MSNTSQEISEIVQHLNKMGFSNVDLERVLDLDYGWLAKAEDSTTLTLLRIIKTFPWMLRVASKDYDPVFAKREMLHRAIDIMELPA